MAFDRMLAHEAEKTRARYWEAGIISNRPPSFFSGFGQALTPVQMFKRGFVDAAICAHKGTREDFYYGDG